MTDRQHPQRCEKIADRNDIIAFMKFAGFDVELAERTDGVEELTITGFDDTGDTYMLEFASIAPSGENHCDKCDHWDMCEGCPYTDERSATHTSTPAPASGLDNWTYEDVMQEISEAFDRGVKVGEESGAKAERERVLDEQHKKIVFELPINKLKHQEYINRISRELDRFMLEGSCNGKIVLYNESLRGGEQE